MRILFIGDIVGKVGRNAIAEYLPKIKQSYRPCKYKLMLKMQRTVRV